MRTVMFYCQYLTGMGHLVRSTEIVRSLKESFRVFFVNGGPAIDGFSLPEGVESIRLPALWIEDGQLTVETINQTVEEVKAARIEQLVAAFDRIQPDYLITEFFPFGRHKLLFELLPLLVRARSHPVKTQIWCSLRDVIGRDTLSEEADTICDLVNCYFDGILFHCDRRFQRFEDSFPQHGNLHCPVYHTGFVAQAVPSHNSAAARPAGDRPIILASVGGGRLGGELLEAVLHASPLLATRIPHRIHLFTGPFMPDTDVQRLQAIARRCSNVCLERYTPNLLEYMARADLSISLAGYNTTMNVLQTGVPALMLPLGHYNRDREQLARTQKLEQLGIVRAIDREDLEPTRLAEIILTCLYQPRPGGDRTFDLDGARNSTAILMERINREVAYQSIGA